jgi:hypothetical protein
MFSGQPSAKCLASVDFPPLGVSEYRDSFHGTSVEMPARTGKTHSEHNQPAFGRMEHDPIRAFACLFFRCACNGVDSG